MNTENTYYDWGKTLSYDADVTMVVGARGIGKTYGLRKTMVNGYIKHGYRFCEVTRTEKELPNVARDYFMKLQFNDEFPGYIFRVEGERAYIAKKPKSEDDKPQWDVIGYFCAMNSHQRYKKMTFINVHYIVMDEAILDIRDATHHYIRSEFSVLADLVDTVSRERPDSEAHPRVYLLGNALDLLNPYFERYHINTVPRYGYQWYDNKTFILHYCEPGSYEAEKKTKTVAGRMLSGLEETKANIDNQFMNANEDFIEDKPRYAKFVFGVVFNGKAYGIWYDWRSGLYHVNRKLLKGSPNVFAMTRADNTYNRVAAGYARDFLRNFAKNYYAGLIRYENVSVREGFLDAMVMFGVNK